MKNLNCNLCSSNYWIYIILATILFSCSSSRWTVPPEYVGQWETNKERITVRTKFKNEPFRFFPDSAYVKIQINDDKTVSGFIGLAEFRNAKLKKNANWLPWDTGIEFIIECGSIGKIFENDPLNSKEVELWLSPLKGNIIDGELRYTQGGAQFPMAGVLFMKVKE
jgi:hypothetical protein